MTRPSAPSVVVHAHFYQPPREDPWLEEVEREPSAAPFHDWNERIDKECYRTVIAARRHAADGRIAAIVNTLESISFDVGPTLLAWLERHAPRSYEGMLRADRRSARRFGHGNALAMPYHHIILPLATRRDKATEVRWGIADFQRRFGRSPEGMWLPETGVDEETLDVLAAAGIRFTVLAPHQVEDAPPGGLPGRYRTSGGRDIALFTYDGPLSNGIAFGGLLHDAASWAERMVAPDETVPRRALVAVATDGETYGHHHKFGEVALAWMLDALEHRKDVHVENFAAVLARHAPRHTVRLVAPTSWSCAHGVERWRTDCACRMAPDPSGRPMRWRAPLRQAFDWLAGELHALFEREGAPLLGDPWAARDAYVPDDAPERSRVPAGATVRARELLELEWHALSMFTSCGWFFDDISGIEALQVMRYAARAIELAGTDAARLEAGLLERLALAVSGTSEAPTGRDLYQAHVRPRLAVAARVGAGAAAAARLAPGIDVQSGAAYEVRLEERDSGAQVTVRHRRTGREDTVHLDWVEPDRRLAAGPRFTMSSDSDGAESLELGDLPERYRLPVAAALRGEVISRTLTAAERSRLDSGNASLADLLSDGLLRAIGALASLPTEGALAHVLDLVDALELTAGHIPFDVQTEFARVRESLTPEQVAVIEPLGHRLGFSEKPL